MADSNITIKDAAGNLVPVDGRTTPNNEFRQAVVIGDGENAGLVDLNGHFGLDGASPPALVGSGLRGWLRGIYERLNGTLTVHVDNQTTAAVDVSGLVQDATLTVGLGGPGSAPPALPGSGSGLLGYLRAVRDLLAGTLTVGGTITPDAAGDAASTLSDGRKTVAAPGGAVAIVSASTPCKWVQVVALKTNTQQVNVGGSGALATAGSSTGTPLDAGQSTTIPVTNANKVFVDARVAGEGVSFTVGT